MKYKKFGKLDWMISEVSIGVLRLEETVSCQDEVGAAERTAAIRFAIDNGVNYMNLGYPLYFDQPDTACSYIRAALADGYRDKVRVAVNIASRDIASWRDLDRAVDKQLVLFGLEKADFCMIDGIYRATWPKLREAGIATWAPRLFDSGKADHIGLTFHDDAYYLKEIHDTYPDWAMIQLELSLVDAGHHPGVGGLQLAQGNNTPVVATDCTKAGRMLCNIPENVQAVWDRANPLRTPAEWCVRWVLNLPEVASVLLNFESADRVQEYFAYAEPFNAGDINVWETLQAAKIRDAYDARRFIQCTACRCCMPCPLGIDAPRLIELYNDARMFDDDRIPRFLYSLEKHQEIDCSQCGLCMTACPKHFPIPAIVTELHNKYGR